MGGNGFLGQGRSGVPLPGTGYEEGAGGENSPWILDHQRKAKPVTQAFPGFNDVVNVEGCVFSRSTMEVRTGMECTCPEPENGNGLG